MSKSYVLSEEKAETRLLSNDAFFWLKDEEPPLDESNLEEADEIIAMFPNGFVIKDDWKYDEDDLIEVTFIPYVEDNSITWDGESTSCYSFLFKILSHTECYARWQRDSDGHIIYEGKCEVKHILGYPWAITPNGSQMPLFGKSTHYTNTLRF